MSNYIEPRLRRDFSGVLNAFVDFLKGNHPRLLSVFLSLNFVFIVIFFFYNYLLADGVASLVAISSGDFGGYMDYSTQNSTGDYETITTIAIILVYILMIACNAGIAGSYLKAYENSLGKTEISVKDILQRCLRKFWGLALIQIIGAIGFLPLFLILFIFTILTLGIGGFLALFVFVAYISWIGLSCFAYVYHDDMPAINALGRGWQLFFSQFWKSLGVCSVFLFLLVIFNIAFQLMPALIIGIISYNSTLDQIELQENIYIKGLSFLFYAIGSISTTLIYMLTMFMYGYLYLNLHEGKYNVYLQSRIHKIGKHL